MFRGAVGQHVLSLMPASEFAQKKVGVMAWLADVVHDDRAANFARVVDDDVAKAHQSLRNRGLNRHVLDFAQWNVFGGASDEASVDLEFRVGDSVLNHVAADVVVSRNQQQGQRHRYRDRSWYAQRSEEKYQGDAGKYCERVTRFDKEHRWSNREDRVLEIVVTGHFEGTRLQASDARGFRIGGWSAAVRTETDAWGYVCSATRTRHGGNHATDIRRLITFRSDQNPNPIRFDCRYDFTG